MKVPFRDFHVRAQTGCGIFRFSSTSLPTLLS